MGRPRKVIDPMVAKAQLEKKKAAAEKMKAAAEKKKAALEKAKAALEKAKAEAKAEAEKKAAKAAVSAKQRELCIFLIIFCLHYHACSVNDIQSVLQAYDLKRTRQEVADCIEENRLLTYKDVLPADEGERSVFRVNQTPEFSIERIHLKQMRLKMTHPELPPVWSAARVFTHGPKKRPIVTLASKKLVMFDIFNLGHDAYPLEPLVPHFTRCMRRAFGSDFPPRELKLSPRVPQEKSSEQSDSSSQESSSSSDQSDE